MGPTSPPEAGEFPVFVVGAPRSGTTLVYSILLASGAFPAYEAESRILECSTRYGRFRSRRGFDRFFADFTRSRQFARSGLDRDRLYRAARASCRTWEGFLALFMGSMAGAQGKSRWVEKTPNHVLYLRRLASAFPDARFIHVIRDGRDVAVSQRQTGMLSTYSEDPLVQLIWGGKLWQLLAEAGRRRGRRLGERYLEVRYEDVVADLEGTLAKLGDFAEVRFDPAEVRSARVGALKSPNTAFDAEEIGKLSDRPVGRWKALSPDERGLLESAIRDPLASFGYPLSSEDPPASRRARLRARAHAAAAHVLLLGKRWLNRYTPIGRIATKPLEIGRV